MFGFDEVFGAPPGIEVGLACFLVKGEYEIAQICFTCCGSTLIFQALGWDFYATTSSTYYPEHRR